jgi:hypothetical protein
VIQIAVADWQQVPQSTGVNSLSQCSCGHGLNTAHSEFSIAKDDAFHMDWIYIGTGKDVDFRSYMSVDSELDMQHFQLQVHCVVIMKVVRTVERKKETKMSLSQYRALPKHALLTELLDQAFTCMALANMASRRF